MSIFNVCPILLALSISIGINAAGRKSKVCNFKDIEVTDVEMTVINSPVDKSKTYMEVAEKNGRNVINGAWTLTKDLPLHAQIKWEMYALEEGNHAIKRAEGMRTTFCSYLINQKPLADMILKHSDIPPICPIKKGSYKINGAGPDLKVIPCYAPGKAESWELRFKIIDSLTQKSIMEVVQKHRLIR